MNTQVANPSSSSQHFETGHLLKDLKWRTASGGFLTGLSQGAQFGLNLVLMVVLARILTPRDFGLVAMVTVVMGFLRIFRDAGLSTATVQREGITQGQVSNLFWVNVGISGVMTFLMIVFSPAVAWFYKEPKLTSITLALSSTFILNGLTVQHQALMTRQMRFKAVTGIDVGSMLFGVVVGVSMAVWRCGYWSLVGLTVSTAAAKLLLTWKLSSWRPQRFTRGSGTRPLIGFGASLMTSNFIYSIARGSDGLLIGRFFGAESAGLYSRAGVLLMRPLDQLLGPITAVFVPVLSRLQNDPGRYRRTFLLVCESAALACFLFTGLFLALCQPLTVVLLGPKWEKAGVIFGAFSFVALFLPVTTVATLLFNSQGRGADSVRSSAFVSVITVIAFAIGLPFGPYGVALAYAISGILLQMPILFHIAGRYGPVCRTDLWLGFLKHLPVWFVVAGMTYLMGRIESTASPLKQVLVCSPVGLLGGVVFIAIFSPSRALVVRAFGVAREMSASRGQPRA